MIRYLQLLLVISLSTIPMSLYAYVVNGIEYSYDFNNKTATVKSVVATGHINIPSSIYAETYYSDGTVAQSGTLSVVAIGYYAFNNRAGITKVTIPNSVMSIDNEAFCGCTDLASIVVAAGNPNFDSRNNCNGIIATASNTLIVGCKNTTIPNSVTSIGGIAFDGCSGLTSVTIPNSVTSIGYSAFRGCSGLTSVTIPNSVTSIGDYAFDGCSGLANLILEDGEDAISGLYFPDSPFETIHLGRTTSAAFAKGKTTLKTLTIGDKVTSIANNAFSYCSGLTSVTIGNSVTSIGGNAFYGCSSLTSVTIGNLVTSIGNYAFYGCSGLTSVTIGNSVTSIGGNAFYGCSSLTSVTIGNLVTSIGNYAFYGCSGLTSVTIPNSVTSIGNYAFRDCSNLATVNFYAENCTTIGCYTYPIFTGCSNLKTVNIGKTVKKISSDAFYRCSGLKNLILEDGEDAISGLYFPDSPFETIHLGRTTSAAFAKGKTTLKTLTIGDKVTSIAESAFWGCSGLTSVSIGDSVTSISGGAFSRCTGLTSVSIPNSVTSIGEYAFKNCSGLTSVTIGNSVTSISEGAFDGCSGLTSVTIPNSVTSIGDYAFDGCSGLANLILEDGEDAISGLYFPDSPFETIYLGRTTSAAFAKGKTTLKTLTIGDKVTSITNSAFEGCSGLTGDLTIPNSVTSIGEYAFNNCSGLNGNLTLGNSVATIGKYTFSGCSGLTGDLTIPNSVTSIGEYAFNNCSGLNGNLTLGNSVATIGKYTFSGCSGLTGDLTIPNSVTEIAECTFSGCSGLISVTIPSSVLEIGDAAFNDCSSISNLTIEDSDNTLILEPILFQRDTQARGQGTFYDSPLTTLYIGRNLSYGSLLSCGYSPFIGQKELVSVTIGKLVTAISDQMFNSCSGLKSVTVPNSVALIEEGAFNGCSSLANLILEDGEDAISGLSFPDSPLETLYLGRTTSNAFAQGKTTLKTLTIGDKVTSITNNAFIGCSGLTDVTIGNSVTEIGSSAFSGCTCLTGELVIPNSVTTIGAFAFFDCYSLSSINISNSVTAIDGGAFGECSGITTLTIGNSVKTIGDYAFDGCSKLTELTIPKSVETIGNHAFDGLSSLSVLNLDDGKTFISGLSFPDSPIRSLYFGRNTLDVFAKGKTSLVELHVGANVKEIPNSSFEYCTGLLLVQMGNRSACRRLGNNAFKGCSQLESLTLGNSVDVIGESAFLGCTSLTSVNLKLVSKMGSSAFAGCEKLNKILIPNTLSSISDGVFYGCFGLESVTIGANIDKIGNNAFLGCEALTNITSLNTTPPICESSCFSDVIYSKATLRVPTGTKDLYSEAGTWKEFFNTTDDALVSVAVTTQNQNVKFAVPKISEAIKYSVNVYKDMNMSDLVTTQSCDASGQIMPMSTSIELEVVGLEYGLYYYEVIVTNESDNALYNDVGSFDIVRPTDENGYYLIFTPEDLTEFARIVNNDSNNASLNAKLMADIDLSDYPYFSIGTVDNNFRGIFDGNGKKLSIALYGTEYVSPLTYVKGATIKNLTVDGTINAKGKFASGIVGCCAGDSVGILNCISQVSIISSVSGDGSHAGLVGIVSPGTTLDISNCAFLGSISNAPSGNTNSCAGLIGWVEDGATSSISNSYVAATFNVNSYQSNVFARNTSNVTATNCYYLNSFGSSLSGTTQKSSEQFASGGVAYLLQGEGSEQIWGQNIDNGEEIQLLPTLNGAKVYFGYKNFNGVDSLVYTNDSTATPIGEFSRDENGNYLIYSADDLYLFASLSNIGMIAKANAKLMNDINTSEYPKFTLGTASNAYNGVFDGNGKTLTVALEGNEFVAPMGYVKGATVKNLVVDGTIRVTGKWAAGIIGRIIGNHVSISNCISKVAINSSVNGDGTHGGIVGEAYSGTLSIVNCGSEVSINGESTTRCGGLIGWTNITATISNSYSSVDFKATSIN